jgi:(p)ppGpp synthase/HD superfamily hydrolase
MDLSIYEHWSDGGWQEQTFLTDLERLPTARLKLIKNALVFAKEKHKGQHRDDAGQYPYYVHVIRVGRILIEELDERDSDVLIAAMLHDVVEDCEVTPEELSKLFSPRIAKIVASLSENSYTSRHEYLDHVKNAPTEVKRIKLADRLDNLRSMPKVVAVWPKRDILDYLSETERYLLPYTKDISDSIFLKYQDLIDHVKRLL